MELRYYLNLLRRWAWLLILGGIIGAVGAYAASWYQPLVFSSTTKAMVMRTPIEAVADYSASMSDRQVINTYAQLIFTEPVLRTVGEKLGFPVSKGAISIRQVPDAQLLELTVEDNNPQSAALIANTLLNVLIEYNESLQAGRFASSEESLQAQIAQIESQIDALELSLVQISQETIQTQLQDIEQRIAELTSEIQAKENQEKDASFEKSMLELYQDVYLNILVFGETSTNNNRDNQIQATLALYQQIHTNLLNNYENIRLERLRSTPNVVQIEIAPVPTRPIRPQPLNDALLGAAVGVFVMGAIAFLIEYLDDTIRDPDEIPRQLDLPVLGLIAHHNGISGKVISAAQPRSPITEAFRALRINIQNARGELPLKTLMITSPSPSDGKSTISTNLGTVIVQSGRSVVLMDADMHRPKLHIILKMSNRLGVSNLLSQSQIRVENVIRETNIPGLKVVTTGDLPLNPAELLGSERMSEVLREIGANTDMIVIDSPPILAVTDPAALASRVDGVLLVIKPGVTKMAAAKQAVEQLQRSGAQILGVVLNDVDINRSRSKYYYKGYYYQYSYHNKYGYEEKK